MAENNDSIQKQLEKNMKYTENQAAKQSEYLRELLDLEKAGQRMTEDEEKLLVDFWDAQIKTSKDTASMISKSLGAEEAFNRELQHQFVEMFNEDAESRAVWLKGSQAEKDALLGQMKAEAIARLGLDEKQAEMYADQIAVGMEKAVGNMDAIVEKAGNIFQPLADNMLRAMDDVRHSIVEKFPNAFRLVSDEMIEHYKSGAKEVGQHFQKHMSTIMAPMEAITGPLIAIGKTMFTIGKTLFSGPTKMEIENAKVQREIRDAVKKRNKDAKKADDRSWTEKMKDKARNVYAGVKEGPLGKLFGLLAKVGPMLIAGLSTVFSFVMGTLVPMLPLIIGIGAAFVAAGLIIWNIVDDFENLKTLFQAGDWAGFIKNLVADILAGLFKIPEWIINSISEYFVGSDFRVDFGKESIMNLFADLETWFYNTWVVPIMETIDAFGIFFDNIGKLVDTIKSWVLAAPARLMKGILSFFGGGDDEEATEETPTEEKPLANKGIKKTYRQKKMDAERQKMQDRSDQMEEAGVTSGTFIGGELYIPGKALSENQKSMLRMTKSMGNALPAGITEKDIAISSQNKRQTDATNKVSDKLDTTNKSIGEGTAATNQATQTIINNTQVKEDKDIPSDLHDLGVMFNNQTHGV